MEKILFKRGTIFRTVKGHFVRSNDVLPQLCRMGFVTSTHPFFLIINRLQQIINGDMTSYLYDAANRLQSLSGQQVYTFDDNGNLLNSDTLTNTFDAANQLINSTNSKNSLIEGLETSLTIRFGVTLEQ